MLQEWTFHRLQTDGAGFNGQLTLFVIVNALPRLLAIDATDDELTHIFDSYNGSLDVYVRALSYSTIGMAALQSRPARNDAADLAHLLYVSVDTEFATDDGALRALAEVAGVRVLASQELIAERGTPQ